MAYIVGELSEKEEEILKKRGWDVEILTPDIVEELLSHRGRKLRMVFVDTDMLKIMSGPDWNISEE